MRTTCARCLSLIASAGPRHGTSVGRSPSHRGEIDRTAAKCSFGFNRPNPSASTSFQIPSRRHLSLSHETVASHAELSKYPRASSSRESWGEAEPPEPLETSSWTDIGIPLPLVSRVRTHYPHILAPTPAQRSFLFSVFKGQDVFLRDDMGRGKTFAVVLAALTLVYRTLNRAMRRGHQALPKGPKIIILVPTGHLAQQVEDHLNMLDPLRSDSSRDVDTPSLFTHLRPVSHRDTPDSPILLATPRDLATYPDLALPHLELIFTDEPDTMLGPVPARRSPTSAAAYHPINRHPPALVALMNDLLSITAEPLSKEGTLSLDFGGRRLMQTVWTSATIHGQVRRFARTRGWVRKGEEVVDLDFTVLASDKQRIARVVAGQLPRELAKLELAPGDLTPVMGVDPEHFALVVDPLSGKITHLTSTPLSSPTLPKQEKDGTLSPVLLESLALLHSTSPPPEGTYALVLPPEGISLDALALELDSLGIPATLLSPEALAAGLSLSDSPSLLLARRSTITGLHLANLHTIYLLSGLDVSGLSVAQRRGQGGATLARRTFYEIVAGRVGRLGTSRYGEGARQRVVSLVLAGGEEEAALSEMFFEDRVVAARGDGEEVRRRKLAEWDLEAMGRAMDGA